MPQPSRPSEERGLLMFLNMVDYLAHWSTEARARLAAGDIAGAREMLRGADTLIAEILSLHHEIIKHP